MQKWRTWQWLFVAALIAMALALGACGDDDSDAATTTPTATRAADETPAPSPTPEPASAYPVTVTDLLGRTVTIEAKPERVVALSPTAAEMVYAAGATIIGRTSSVDYPPEAVEAADVGTAYQPSFEQILALEPDLVVADSVIQARPDLMGPIEQLGVPVVFAGAESLDDVIAGLALMGKVFDEADTTASVIAEIEAALDEARAALSDSDVSAVILITDRDQVLYAAKDDSFAGDVLKQLGIENPAATQPDSGPFPGYTTVAPETLLAFNPTFIFTITPAPVGPRLSELVKQIPPFAGLEAVQQDRVVELDLQVFLQAPGPRIVEAFAAIAEAVAGT
ncbi:MAG: ABC transporter substrate-binding protein [Dehalococcoidia bacterium]